MSLRPDEIANRDYVERSDRAESKVKQGISTAAAIGTTALGAGLTARLLPMLSEFIPAQTALKGISKISPKIGDFLQNGLNAGLNLKDGLDFIRGQLSPPEKEERDEAMEAEEPAKEGRNIIEQYDPNLFEYIKGMIAQGNTPEAAAAKSKKFLDKKKLDLIAKIEKDHKTDWASIVSSIFGGNMATSPGQSQQAQAPAQAPAQAQEQPPGSAGGVDPQLLSIMNQMRSTMQKITGK